MSVSSLREITLGVEDLDARRRQLNLDCGIPVLSAGTLTPTTAWRLFDLTTAPAVAVLARAPESDGPRVRLVETAGQAAVRPHGLLDPGPLGLGLTVRGIAAVRERLQRDGVRFVSPPIAIPVGGSEEMGLAAYGQAADGDFFALAEPLPSSTAEVGRSACEPRHAHFVVTNLDACVHFVKDVLDQQVKVVDRPSSPAFDAIFGRTAGAPFRIAAAQGASPSAGGLTFIEFERRLTPAVQSPPFGRGLCRLRFDTVDLHATLARVPGGGGSLVRGPSGIDDTVVGRGLVALVRSPFGVVIELWQTT